MTNPLISVLTPIRNEAAFIERSLGAVLTQDYPADRIEILVADGMSTDDTREIVQSLQAKHPNLHLIDNPGRIVPTGLNAAIEHVKGEIIIRVDGHTEIAPDYISRCVAYLADQRIDCVGGFIDTVASTLSSQTIALAMSSSFGVGGVAFRTRPGRMMEVDTAAFGAYRRSVFERCGLLDEEMISNQDGDVASSPSPQPAGRPAHS